MRNVRLAAGSDPPNPIIGDLVMDSLDSHSCQKVVTDRFAACLVGQPEAPPERVVAILYMPMSGLLLDYGQLRSNAKSAGGSMPKATRSGRTRLIACDGHSLHFGLSAPPTASQASVPGVAIETQLCSNGRERQRANCSLGLFHLTYK